MDILVDSVEVQEYHEFSRAFTRAGFDGDQLAKFLNERPDHWEAKWVVRGGKRNSDKEKDEDDRARERVIVENVPAAEGSWLHTEKVVIDQDSVLWLAKSNGKRTIPAEDYQAHSWPALEQCYVWLKEFYELDGSFFASEANRYRDMYLTKTEGVQIGCRMQDLLRRELWKCLEGASEAAYAERGLQVTLHPFGIMTKVNFKPKAEAMARLTQGQLKASIGGDDLEIGVRRYEDYEERIISFGSQMPYHWHVRALRSLIEVARTLGEAGG